MVVTIAKAAGCAISMQKHGLPPLNQHALHVIGEVAYHDNEGTGRKRKPKERARLLADLSDHHILVLRNHGLLVVGSTIAAAFVATYRSCSLQRRVIKEPGHRRSRRCAKLTFGFDRCMWGTDWMRAVKLLTYAEGVDAFRLAQLSDGDRAKLMGGTLSRIYDWSPAKA